LCKTTAKSPPNRETNGSLVFVLAKAYRWQEQLELREYAGLEDLASANGVDRTYVGRILQLASLSPEIAERILDGEEPEGLSPGETHQASAFGLGAQKWD
jgi:hypothetical protein